MTPNTDPTQRWEQVGLEVDQDQAERTADLLGEILGSYLVIEKNYGDLFPDQLDQYQGLVRIYGYYPEDESALTRDRIRAALRAGGIESELEFFPLENRDWATAWQERYQPVPVGERLIIVPTWLENPQPERLAVQIDPGMAFGSGTHPTTQLSLELIEKYISEKKPPSMIDIGCGSGILSIAGARLGLAQVLGVDCDPDAVRISRENAAVNQVAGRTSFQQGSAAEIRRGETPLPQASLVVANIIAPILHSLFEEGLSELISPAGILVLSGILEEQSPGLQAWLERTGLVLLEERRRGEWIGLVSEKTSRS